MFSYGAAPNGGGPAELRIFFSKQCNVDETNHATILEHIFIIALSLV